MEALLESDQESLPSPVQRAIEWLENGIITHYLMFAIWWGIFPPPFEMKKIPRGNLEQPSSADSIYCPKSQLRQRNRKSKTQLRWSNCFLPNATNATGM